MTKLQCAIRYIGTKKLGEYIFFIHCKFRYEIDPWRVVRVHLPNFQITYASKLFLRLKRPVLAVRPLLMLAASFCGFSVLFSNFVLSSNWIAVDMVWTYYEPRLTMGGGVIYICEKVVPCWSDPFRIGVFFMASPQSFNELYTRLLLFNQGSGMTPNMRPNWLVQTILLV